MTCHKTNPIIKDRYEERLKLLDILPREEKVTWEQYNASVEIF